MKRISQKEFDDIVEKYKNDETLWEEFKKDSEQVKKTFIMPANLIS